LNRLAPLLLCVFALATPFRAMASAPTPLSAVIDDALAAGSDALLPTALAVPLGLSSHDQATPVHELVGRTDHVTRRFCVGISHRHEILMLTEDDDSHVTSVFLVSAAGKLRKAVTRVAGGEAMTVPRTHAASAFLVERDYWTDGARARAAAH
jgi:hypothetical protein